MTWRRDGDLLFCPRCHHGQQAHHTAAGQPVACVAAKGRYFDPATGRMRGTQRGAGDGACGCTFALDGNEGGTAA